MKHGLFVLPDRFFWDQLVVQEKAARKWEVLPSRLELRSPDWCIRIGYPRLSGFPYNLVGLEFDAVLYLVSTVLSPSKRAVVASRRRSSVPEIIVHRLADWASHLPTETSPS